MSLRPARAKAAWIPASSRHPSSRTILNLFSGAIPRSGRCSSTGPRRSSASGGMCARRSNDRRFTTGGCRPQARPMRGCPTRRSSTPGESSGSESGQPNETRDRHAGHVPDAKADGTLCGFNHAAYRAYRQRPSRRHLYSLKSPSSRGICCIVFLLVICQSELQQLVEQFQQSWHSGPSVQRELN